MLKEERQQAILEILAAEQSVLAYDLSQKFAVSEETIRRDLKELDQKELVRRVHRGALKVSPPITNFATRKNISMDMKAELAQKTMGLMREGSTILIDGGTTNLEWARRLPRNFQATIVTNSPPLAVALEEYPNLEVIVLGGILYKESMVNLGIYTIQALKLMNIDYYLMGVYNIDPQMGVSVPTLLESQVKRVMAEVSTEVIGLVTPDKMGTVSKHIIGPADILTTLVATQSDTEQKLLQKFSELNITIVS